MENKRVVLGLDISTTTIGCCIMVVENGERKILKAMAVSPKINKKIKGIESLFLKKKIFEEEFLTKYLDTPFTDVVIEAPLIKSNNINTVVTLIQFNSLISESIYDTLGIVPEIGRAHV